jgi:hypothetical protein
MEFSSNICQNGPYQSNKTLHFIVTYSFDVVKENYWVRKVVGDIKYEGHSKSPQKNAYVNEHKHFKVYLNFGPW